jgi:quercetin dioxygenase-like cupin family protein
MEFHGTQRLGGCCLLSRGIIRERARQRRISTVSMTHLPPGEGKSLWVSNNEFVTIKTTGKDTAGEFALVELVALPGAEPPPHIHHSTDETYCLLQGELEVLDGESTFTARAGSVFYIPKGTLHAWKNATTEPARVLLVITPAGFEGVIEEVGVPGTLSSPPPPPPPLTAEDLQRIEELGRKYDTEYPPVPAW